jgi:hypothetical protein
VRLRKCQCAPCCQHPCDCPTEPRNEIPPVHSITSSARTSSAVGIFYPQGFRGLEIDDQLDLRGLLHRKIGRLFAVEDAARIITDQPKQVAEVRPVAHETAGRGEPP